MLHYMPRRPRFGPIAYNFGFLSGSVDFVPYSGRLIRKPRRQEVQRLYDAVQDAASRAQILEAASNLESLAALGSPRRKALAVDVRRRAEDLLDTDLRPRSRADRRRLRDELFSDLYTAADKYRATLLLELLQIDDTTATLSTPNGQPPPDAQIQDCVLHARDISYGVDQAKILSNCSVSLRPGTILGLVGANGAGKTSLLRVLASFVPYWGGDLRYPLLELKYMSTSAILSRIYLARQEPTEWKGTAEQTLETYAALRGISRDDNQYEVAAQLSMFGLRKFASYTFSELSTGYKVRFELAKAMLGQPELLLLDEPLGPLDPQSRREYMRQLRDLANVEARQLGIIVSSHDTAAIEQIADDVLVIDNGTLFSTRNLNEERPARPSIFEVVTEGGDEELRQAVLGLNDASLDFSVVPPRLELPAGVTSRRVLRHLMRMSANVLYFRNISDSSERFLSGHLDDAEYEES